MIGVMDNRRREKNLYFPATDLFRETVSVRVAAEYSLSHLGGADEGGRQWSRGHGDGDVGRDDDADAGCLVR